MKKNFKNDDCHIKLAHDSNMIIPVVPEDAKTLMLIGNWENVFGEWNDIMPFDAPTFSENFLGNVFPFLRRGGRFVVMCDKITKEYVNGIFKKLEKCCGGLGISNPLTFIDIDKMYNVNDELNFKILEEKKMKFDMIIQNPPYSGSFHLDFLEQSLNILNEKGKMVIVEPATWLINVRKNGKASRYAKIKNQIERHVESVVIENLNNEFETDNQVPFATTTIDMGKTFETIDFTCFGEHRTVSSLYECNLIGDYKTIWSILEKCQNFGNMMKSHITNKKIENDCWYVKYADKILGRGFCSDGKRVFNESTYQNVMNGNFHINYITCCYHIGKENIISNNPICKKGSNKEIQEDIIAGNLYGTKEELENWKNFIFNNKLPLFLNIVLTIDQNNVSEEFIPWLVDKQYTDDEINKLFGFTEEEIRLMDVTLKKYERNSPWFKRYMCGKDSATDEEVNEFIKRISE